MAHPAMGYLQPASGGDDQVWDLFHENSKMRRYDPVLPAEQTRAWIEQLSESLPFRGYPLVPLPGGLTLGLSLGEALTARGTARDMEPCPLSLPGVATLLHHAYGLRSNEAAPAFQRRFRMVPSAGSLYPLEVYFHSTHVEGLDAGLYHYNPHKNNLRLLRSGDQSVAIARALVQKSLSVKSSLIVFVTAVFERTVFKYGDRGYRFVLLEAGHLAQNVNLVASALGLGCIDIGGFLDHEVDRLLDIDGLTQSTVYMIAIGKQIEAIDPRGLW